MLWDTKFQLIFVISFRKNKDRKRKDSVPCSKKENIFAEIQFIFLSCLNPSWTVSFFSDGKRREKLGFGEK